MEEDTLHIDEALIEPFEMVSAFGEVPLYFEQEFGGELLRIGVDTLKFSVPIELDVYLSEKEVLLIGTNTPVYDFETSFGTVLHQLKMTFKVEDDQANEQ